MAILLHFSGPELWEYIEAGGCAAAKVKLRVRRDTLASLCLPSTPKAVRRDYFHPATIYSMLVSLQLRHGRDKVCVLALPKIEGFLAWHTTTTTCTAAKKAWSLEDKSLRPLPLLASTLALC